MNTEHKKIKEIIEHLSNELFWGKLFTQIAEALHKKYRENGIVDSPNFFAGTYEACLRESILSLSKLVINDKNSINLFYLLNFVKMNTGSFKYTTKENLKKSVENNKNEIQKLSSLIDSIKTQRDCTLAHLDRKHINNPSSIFSKPINMTEVKHCFDKILSIVNEYKGYFEDSEFYLGLVEKSINDEVAYLFKVLNKPYKEREKQIKNLLNEKSKS